jgi:hypothetical protein
MRMKNDRYDEYQLNNRNRIAFETLMIITLLILINGFVKMTYIWAEPLMETLVLLYIPGIYFALRSIWKNAYFSKKEKHPGFYNALFLLITLVNLYTVVTSIYHGFFVIIEDGKLANSAGVLFMLAFTSSITIAMIARKFANKRVLGSN